MNKAGPLTLFIYLFIYSFIYFLSLLWGGTNQEQILDCLDLTTPKGLPDLETDQFCSKPPGGTWNPMSEYLLSPATCTISQVGLGKKLQSGQEDRGPGLWSQRLLCHMTTCVLICELRMTASTFLSLILGTVSEMLKNFMVSAYPHQTDKNYHRLHRWLSCQTLVHSKG